MVRRCNVGEEFVEKEIEREREYNIAPVEKFAKRIRILEQISSQRRAEAKKAERIDGERRRGRRIPQKSVCTAN